MIALDTNIVIRFLTRDDPKQSQIVFERFEQAEQCGDSFFIPLVVVLETVWVLESVYQKSREQTLDAIEEMLRLKIFRFERDEVIVRVLSDARAGRFDLSDLIVAHSARFSGCRSAITFDKGAAKHPFFQLLR